jgi:hypothetical protein
MCIVNDRFQKVGEQGNRRSVALPDFRSASTGDPQRANATRGSPLNGNVINSRVRSLLHADQDRCEFVAEPFDRLGQEEAR